MTNKNYNFEWRTLWELKEILSNMKLYKDLTTKLWKRWKILFKSLIENKSIYKIEYYDKISNDLALEEWLKAFEKVFNEKIDKKDIIFREKSNLEWWIRVFKDDNMVDLSFSKIEKLIKN